MKVAIHQPHYFPWEGYFNKILTVDKFILMDDVQLTDSSYMYRHKLLSLKGEGKYITIPFDKVGYKNKKYKEIRINNKVDWKVRQFNFLKENYNKSPYYDEVMQIFNRVLSNDSDFLCDFVVNSINILVSLFDIKTPIFLQSELDYDKNSKKNDLVLSLCESVGADLYLSGNGARKYMDLNYFKSNGVDVHYQEFTQSVYKQHSSIAFVPGLSILDMMLNCGINETKKIITNNANVSKV